MSTEQQTYVRGGENLIANLVTASRELVEENCRLKEEINRLRAEVARLEEENKRLKGFVRECRDNWDCDSDAHRYDTFCRACKAAILLPKEEPPP